MDFECLIIELIESAAKTEPNFEKFDIAIDNLNRVILKIKNMKNVCKNKIIFVGRCGSMKNELILYLIKLKLSQFSLSKIKNKYIEYISENNNYGILVDDKTGPIEFESLDSLDEFIQYNYSTFSTHIKIFYPRSENEILKDKILMDTPFYDYSDERDDEIVNNCRDGHIFIVVLDAVEIIGYRDKNFLKRLSEINFIKLIFIFNCMEQVSKDNYDQRKDQHTANATRISNEILLIPPQENIPIFFIENCQINEDKLKNSLNYKDFNEKIIKYIDGIKQKINQAFKLIKTNKREIEHIVYQKIRELEDYEKQKEKADEKNRINKKKNEHIENLKKIIRTISYLENDFIGPPKNLNDIFQQFENFCEIRQSGKKFCTYNCGDSEPIEGENPKHKEKNEILKIQLNYIIEDLKKLWAELNDFNKSSGKTSKDNNNGMNHHHSKSKDQSSSSKKEDDKNIDKNNEEMSEYIENQLNNIENNIEEFNKYSSEYRSFLTEYFQYILQLLDYMNDIVWTGYLTRYSLKETSTFPAIPDKLIEEINFIEIESFNVLLIFLLLIKLFIAKIIEVKENKYSTFHSKSLVTTTLLRYYIKWTGLVKDHHRENMEILNNYLINTKLFDKFKQIKFIKCERNTKYCKSESDSLKTIILENENKLNILNEAEEKINNLMEELEKNI